MASVVRFDPSVQAPSISVNTKSAAGLDSIGRGIQESLSGLYYPSRHLAEQVNQTEAADLNTTSSIEADNLLLGMRLHDSNAMREAKATNNAKFYPDTVRADRSTRYDEFRGDLLNKYGNERGSVIFNLAMKKTEAERQNAMIQVDKDHTMLVAQIGKQRFTDMANDTSKHALGDLDTLAGHLDAVRNQGQVGINDGYLAAEDIPKVLNEAILSAGEARLNRDLLTNPEFAAANAIKFTEKFGGYVTANALAKLQVTSLQGRDAAEKEALRGFRTVVELDKGQMGSEYYDRLATAFQIPLGTAREEVDKVTSRFHKEANRQAEAEKTKREELSRVARLKVEDRLAQNALLAGTNDGMYYANGEKIINDSRTLLTSEDRTAVYATLNTINSMTHSKFDDPSVVATMKTQLFENPSDPRLMNNILGSTRITKDKKSELVNERLSLLKTLEAREHQVAHEAFQAGLDMQKKALDLYPEETRNEALQIEQEHIYRVLREGSKPSANTEMKAEYSQMMANAPAYMLSRLRKQVVKTQETAHNKGYEIHNELKRQGRFIRSLTQLDKMKEQGFFDVTSNAGKNRYELLRMYMERFEKDPDNVKAIREEARRDAEAKLKLEKGQ